MAELRKLRFAPHYWHIVDDDPANQQIIGSLLRLQNIGSLCWRAEYAPLGGAPEDLAVGYFQSEQEALDFLERQVKGEP